MPYGIDAAEDPVKTADTDLVGDRAGAEAQLDELRVRHDAVLPRRQRGDLPRTCCVWTLHINVKSQHVGISPPAGGGGGLHS
jgi:hypothetical protein